MFCTQCGVTLEPNHRFCPQCGRATGVDAPISTRRILALDSRNKKIAGVCAGFARYWDVDATLMRILCIAITIFTGGLGALAYIGAWLIMPKDEIRGVPSTEYVRQS
jgi:phage shock protein C